MSAILPLLVGLLAGCGGGAGTGNEPIIAVNSTAAANLSAVATLGPPPPVDPAIAPFVPAAGTHQARAMAIVVPPEMNALNQRFMAAIQANPAWFQAYRAEHRGPLPWHPNLGLSEAEYRRFQALVYQLSLGEVGRVTFSVTPRPDGGLALAGTGQAEVLNGIVVHPGRDLAETPSGPLTIRAMVNNRVARSPTGPWQGVTWGSVDSPRGRPIKLGFGRRARGDLILYFDYGPSDAETLILLYPAAPAGTAR